MRTSGFGRAGLFLALVVAPAFAEKPLADYSFVRGVCYPGGWRNPQNIIERDLGYAKRLNLNSTRVWLSYVDYEKRGPEFLDQIRNYVRTAHRMGISTMPILWNGNGLDPDILKPEFRARADAYVKAVVTALKDEPGLLLWDVMNEPQTNPWYGKLYQKTSPSAKRRSPNSFGATSHTSSNSIR